MNATEFLTLAKIVKEKKLYHKVAEELKIKPSSVQRELNRIFIYFCEAGSSKQKRSGKKSWDRYLCAMCKVVKREIKIQCFKRIQTRRVIIFERLDEALAYSQPIFYICCLVWDWCESNNWEILIPENSDGIEICFCL